MGHRHIRTLAAAVSISMALLSAQGIVAPAQAEPAQPRVVQLGHYRSSSGARAAAHHLRLRGKDVAIATVAGRTVVIDARGRIEPMRIRKVHPVGSGQMPRPPQLPPEKK